MGLSASPACVTWGGARPRGRLVLPRPLGRAPPHVTQAGLTLRSDVWSLTDIPRKEYNLKEGTQLLTVGMKTTATSRK